MERKQFHHRLNVDMLHAELGFDYGEIDGNPYWAEGTAYVFTEEEITTLENATNKIQQMCMVAVDEILHDDALFDAFGYDTSTQATIRESWAKDEFTCYGRMDLAFDGKSVKLLEYNADTPTSLLESAVVQYRWMQEVVKPTESRADQFNSIHERLIDFWKRYGGTMRIGEVLHLTYVRDSLEDFRTCEYMADTAFQAGVPVKILPIDEIGSNNHILIDDTDTRIKHLFKLYPYEWLMKEAYACTVGQRTYSMLEAPWKMLLSNKVFLWALYMLNSHSEYLLPTFLVPAEGCVKKPRLGREGINVEIDGETPYPGSYGEEGYVWQRRVALPQFDGKRLMIGSWVIDGEAAGICCREDSCPVISNKSLFVPHYFV